MVPGFNHNIRHKGSTYHIQTEDSGIKAPHIITLLYRGGTIIAKEKLSYADIIKADNLHVVVKELMQEQHKAMLKKLISGAFDAPATSAPPKKEDKPAKDSPEIKGGNYCPDEDIFTEKDIDDFILDFLNSGSDDDQ